MARRKEISILESRNHLEQLLDDTCSGGLAMRLRMLILYRDTPSLTLKQAAAQINCNEKTIRRWLKIYQDNGLEGLLGNIDHQSTIPDIKNPAREGLILPVHIKQFLNSFPFTESRVEWISTFRDALQQLLPDVDSVSISIETEADLYGPNRGGKEILPRQYVMETSHRYCVAEVTTQLMNTPPSRLLMNTMHRQRFPFGDYHPPHSFDYHTPGGCYLGTIVLWRYRHAPAISRQTLDTVRQLEPFLLFMLSDCINRRRRECHDAQLFTQIVDTVCNVKELTTRQKEILIHRMLGRSHKEISTHLNITVNTIRDHIKEIYRRSGVQTFAELLALYFTPLGDDKHRLFATPL